MHTLYSTRIHSSPSTVPFSTLKSIVQHPHPAASVFPTITNHCPAHPALAYSIDAMLHALHTSLRSVASADGVVTNRCLGELSLV